MNHRQIVATLATLTGASMAACVAPAHAQDGFPARPVRLVVPFSAGGNLDVLGRIIGQRLSEMWGQPVVIENRTGGGGTLGAAVVAKATPDGYTLLITASGFITNAVLQNNLPYDAIRDFAGVASLGRSTTVLLVSPALGVKTTSELIALARAQPGKLLASSPGATSAGHLNTEKFRFAAGIKTVHVGFKGQPEALIEVAAGRVHFSISGVIPALSLIKEGRLLPLAVTDSHRSPLLPDVPPITDTLPSWRRDGSTCILAPAATPRPVVARISKDVARALSAPDVQERFNAIAFGIEYAGPEALDRGLRDDIASVRKLVKDIGLKPG
jgi:tripartite-type tricarboxylate transporter receptor subunit TctC